MSWAKAEIWVLFPKPSGMVTSGYQMLENIWNHDAAGRVVLLLFSSFWKLLLQQRN